MAFLLGRAFDTLALQNPIVAENKGAGSGGGGGGGGGPFIASASSSAAPTGGAKLWPVNSPAERFPIVRLCRTLEAHLDKDMHKGLTLQGR